MQRWDRRWGRRQSPALRVLLIAGRYLVGRRFNPRFGRRPTRRAM